MVSKICVPHQPIFCACIRPMGKPVWGKWRCPNRQFHRPSNRKNPSSGIRHAFRKAWTSRMHSRTLAQPPKAIWRQYLSGRKGWGVNITQASQSSNEAAFASSLTKTYSGTFVTYYIMFQTWYTYIMWLRYVNRLIARRNTCQFYFLNEYSYKIDEIR